MGSIKFSDNYILNRVMSPKLTTGSVFRLKGDKPYSSKGKFHVHIVLRKDTETDKVLMFTVSGTTQISSRRNYYKQLGVPEEDIPIVYIKGGKYKFFSKDTCIDCGSVDTFNFSSIPDSDLRVIDGRIDEGDLDEIFYMILNKGDDFIDSEDIEQIRISYQEYAKIRDESS